MRSAASKTSGMLPPLALRKVATLFTLTLSRVIRIFGLITRNYAMRAQRILSLDLPVLSLTDSVARALELMDEFKLMHLPVVIDPSCRRTA